MYWIIFIGIMLVSWIVQFRFKSKFKKYSEMPLSSGLSGAEIAQKMLNENGINDVQIISVEGQLTDHYNPGNRTVNLSPEVYHGRSVAAAAVAAHECGHAVQHATAYNWLQFRSAMVPMVSVASRLTSWVLLIGMFSAADRSTPRGRPRCAPASAPAAISPARSCQGRRPGSRSGADRTGRGRSGPHGVEQGRRESWPWEFG